MRPTAIDWFRVLWDLVQRGHPLAAIERSTGISSSTLRGYLEGSQPPHWRGELLIGLWCEVCERPRGELPEAKLVLAPRVVQARPQVMAESAAVRRLEDAWRGR